MKNNFRVSSVEESLGNTDVYIVKKQFCVLWVTVQVWVRSLLMYANEIPFENSRAKYKVQSIVMIWQKSSLNLLVTRYAN